MSSTAYAPPKGSTVFTMPLSCAMICCVRRASRAASAGQNLAPVPPTDLARLKTAACCTLITMPSTRVLTFQLNQERVPAFKDKRVRQAMACAYDHEEMLSSIFYDLAPAGFRQHDRKHAELVASLSRDAT